MKKTWLPVSTDSDFSIYNIPFGIASYGKKSQRVVSRLGDFVIDLSLVAEKGIFDPLKIPRGLWTSSFLNDFIALGKPITTQVRLMLQKELTDACSSLRDMKSIIPIAKCNIYLPVYVRDYTDFYSSFHHAYNVGVMFRDPERAILPNWRHLPVAYHGRASTIVVDGTQIHRPKGQVVKGEEHQPIFGASQRLDFELEMAFIIGKENILGEAISIKEAEEHIFGMVLFNDWSARDIQKWEYVPLGPFLSKSFASTISPWVVTLEALEPFKVKPAPQEPEVLPYLQYTESSHYDIHLAVGLSPRSGEETIISRSNFKYMYWTMMQQLAHHTINGCQVNIGDMMASGTISGSDENSFGSMLELSWGGKKEVILNNGQSRKFIDDHDTVKLYGFGQKGEIRVGFGQASGTILPAK